MTDYHPRGEQRIPEFDDAATAARWRAARRAVLDHLLAVLPTTPSWGDCLVLRGSMAMLCWAGDAAREPADLDFVARPRALVPVDDLHPYPYVDRIRDVQDWPEAAGGAARYEIWTDGEAELETGGAHPVLPPEGLRWEKCPDLTDTASLFQDLADTAGRHPRVSDGIRLKPDETRADEDWFYAGGEGDSDYGTGGIRILFPWQADGLPPGEAQVDVALDEPLPEPPVWAAVPRADGGGPTVVRAASRELSLAWKIVWLHADAAGLGYPRCKDLYDAVLLAEAEETHLAPGLLRRLLADAARRDPDGLSYDPLYVPEEDWAEFCRDRPGIEGTADEWLRRLSKALRTVQS